MIDRRRRRLHRLRDAAVHVPAAVVNRHEANARLAEPPGHQHLFAEALAIAIARARVFFIDVERFARPAQDQIESLLLEVVQAVHRAAAIDWLIT